MKRIIGALVLVSVAGLVASTPTQAARKNTAVVAQTTIPDGTFGGSVTGTYTGDSKALSDTGGVLVKCYAPDRSGPLVFDAGFTIAADGSFVITPLAGWGAGWESGPADCDAQAGYFPITRGSWGAWVTLSSTSFHVSG
jgi:hypothetical protein